MSALFPNHLPPQHVFITRIVRSMALAVILVALALLAGMCGYHYFGNLSWVDAFVNAAMILSGMGPVDRMSTDASKIFAGLYALFSGLFFILILGLILAPLLHRFFHKLKLEEESNKRQ